MNPVQIIAGLITLTAASSYINYKFVKLPKSIGITLIAFFISLFLVAITQINLYWDMDITLNKHRVAFMEGIEFNKAFLHGMLSFLLFAGALHINLDELAKHKVIIIMLSTVSVVISTFIIGVGVMYLLMSLDIILPFKYCLLFGALISPTDPIAVLGLMKTIGASKSLELKIAGESLFNDAMGLVLFSIIYNIAQDPHWESAFFTQQIFTQIVWTGAGGIAVGMVFGVFCTKLLRGVDNYEVAVLVTLSLVTAGYMIADDVLGVSGVVAISTAGLIIGTSLRSSHISRVTLHRLDAFWDLIDEVMNAILFVLMSLEFVRLAFTGSTFGAVIGVVAIVLFARCVSVAVPILWLSLFRKINTTLIWILTWGGLRGGISIALALSIKQSIPERDLIVTLTYAVVIFSVVVQGLTVGPFVRRIIKNQKY